MNNTDSPRFVMSLKRENGKKVTVNAAGGIVALIFWRKSDSVLLPLELSTMEAQSLAIALNNTVKEIRS